jgi:hypothetical protein
VAITRETLRLQQQLRDEVNTITDQQVRDLVGAWADAWDEVSLDLEAALHDLTAASDGRRITRALVMRTERLTRSLLVINNRLTTLAKDAGVRITGDLETVVRLADDFQHDIVASQLPPGGRELVEGRFLGGAARATAIARTEMLDAHRQASRESRIANSDVLAGWVWHSELSVRTCASCWAQDGSLHPADDPGPMDHVNGRCTALPQTKSWADLGFAGMDEPRSIKPDARTTFIALDEREQKAILGPARHEAWKAGEYPMSDWSARRSADGWRDSYGVSRVPQSGGRRGSSTALAS